MAKNKYDNNGAEQNEIEHPLGRDGLIDLSGYLNSLTEINRSLSGENESVQVEFEEQDEEIGKLRVWKVEEYQKGVHAIFRNKSRAMPVTEYDDGLADKTVVMNVHWDVEGGDSNGIAELQLQNKVDSEYPTIGTVTGIDFGDNPTNPPVITLSVTGEWKRYVERHDNSRIFL